MNAMETLRQFGGSAWMVQRFEQKAQEVRDSWRLRTAADRLHCAAGHRPGSRVHRYLPSVAAALQSGGLSRRHRPVQSAAAQLNMPFEMIARSIDDVARRGACWLRFPPVGGARGAAGGRCPAAGESGGLEFQQVSHRYGNGRGVSDVSFEAERGGINFLIGPTAGKSTLFKLALKSIDPQRGRIPVDGLDLSRIDRAAWHAAVAVVPQDVILLNESLADNILLGRARDDDRLRHAARKAAILPLIERPEGWKPRWASGA
jgi:ABC-type multidrug transport system fused ATPase/permease subunit